MPRKINEHRSIFLNVIRQPTLHVFLQIITSGVISSDGKEIALRNYEAIYYWYRKENESIINALARSRDKLLPYVKESQGEGFCFDKDNKGYFTNSERPDGQTTPTSLYYYRKK